ncbi:MAG: hypothetical protein L3K09_06325 [Thermoplasmata archaeon]|nr:hypothetical protein [Thermoplasmata archaeon]
MADGSTASLLIAIPQPVERRMRLGPFPSARDALKFVGYATAGAVFVPFWGGLVWLPFLAAGFAVSVHRPQGSAVDERLLAYCRWRMRVANPDHGPGPLRSPPVSPGSTLRLRGGRSVAILEAGGTPVAYLPPEDARRLFERYRDLLRGVEGAYIVASVGPLSARSFLPTGDGAPGVDREARAGYAELVTRLCQKRHRRVVWITLWGAEDSPAALRNLTERANFLARELGGLGIALERLSGSELRRVASRLGWGRGWLA